MRRRRQTADGTRIVLARSILAAALLFCALASALPVGAVLDLKSSMPCCRGTKGMGGDCHGDSCPLDLGPRAKAPKVIQLDPVCGAEHLLQAVDTTPLPVPLDYLELSHAREHVQTEVEHDHGESVSPHNTAKQQPSAGAAALGRPCPSDCCGVAASSLNSLRRPRQAAVTDELRPRPPTVESYSFTPSGLLKATFALRRAHPPRAPPTALDSRSA